MNIEIITHEIEPRVPTGWEVRVSYDECPVSPRDCIDAWGSTAWVIATVRDPIDESYTRHSVPADAEMVLPVLYTPGSCGQGSYSADMDARRWYIDPEHWPPLQIGFAYLPAGTLAAEAWTRQQAADHLDGELATYTQWANGEVYCWDVYYRGQHVEGCAGYYGLDYCRHEAVQAAIWCDHRQREAAADLQKAAIMAGLGHNQPKGTTRKETQR